MNKRSQILPDFVKEAIVKIYELLQRHQYERVVELTGGVRIPAVDIAQRLDEDYRASIIPFEPELFWESIVVLPYRSESTGEFNFWHVNFPLWLAGEGKSDIMVSIGIELADDGATRWELRDIRAM